MSFQVTNNVFPSPASPVRVKKTVTTTKTYTPTYSGPQCTLVVTEKTVTQYVPVSAPAHQSLQAAPAPQALAVPVSRYGRGLSPEPSSRSPSPVESSEVPVLIPQLPFTAPPAPLLAPQALHGYAPPFVTDPAMLEESLPAATDPITPEDPEGWTAEDEEGEMAFIFDTEEQDRAAWTAALRAQVQQVHDLRAEGPVSVHHDARGLHFLTTTGVRWYFKLELVPRLEEGPRAADAAVGPAGQCLHHDAEGVYVRDREGRDWWITFTERVCPQWEFVPESGLQEGEEGTEMDDDEEMED